MNYTVFIGIDVSKKTLDAAIVRKGEESTVHKKVSNDQAGIEDLLQWVNEHTGKRKRLYCMENTGVYNLELCSMLTARKEMCCVENPLQIKRSMGITRIKNDKADAKMIARYASLHHSELKLFCLPKESIVKLKALLAQRERLMKSKHAHHQASKELKAYHDESVYSLIVEQSNELIDLVEKQLKAIEKAIAELIRSQESLNKNYELAKSVGGVGKTTAAYLLTYTHNFTSFSDWRKFACYCGIAPFEHSSGTSIKGRTKVSQIANKRLKGMLGIGACSAIQHDKELRLYYERKLKEGKPALSVINAVRNKIVSRVFAVVNRGTPYVETMNYA